MNKLSPFRFKPSKQYIFSQRIKNNNFEPQHLRKAYSFSTHQKILDTIIPVRPFTRFIKPKIYGTGMDPSTAFIHFMNKDCEKPYKKKLSPVIPDGIEKPPRKNIKWSLGTTYKCNSKEYLPKSDPFKDYYFHPKNNNEIKIDRYSTINSFRDNRKTNNNKINNEIKNDIIDKDEKKCDLLKMKSNFNFNIESDSFWSPHITNNDNNNFNRSSVNYNILNHKENNISGKTEISLIEKTVNNKKKGVTEFFHLQRNYEPNYSPKFSDFFKENKNGFMRYKGIFTELYDSYIKNGNIYQPFRINMNTKKITNRNRINQMNINTE